jgi:hypothetical protein
VVTHKIGYFSLVISAATDVVIQSS